MDNMQHRSIRALLTMTCMMLLLQAQMSLKLNVFISLPEIAIADDGEAPVAGESRTHAPDDGIARCQITVQDGTSSTDYMIPLNSTFEKVMTTFAREVAQCDVQLLKFISGEGLLVTATMSPKDLDLEKNDTETFDVHRKS